MTYYIVISELRYHSGRFAIIVVYQFQIRRCIVVVILVVVILVVVVVVVVVEARQVYFFILLVVVEERAMDSKNLVNLKSTRAVGALRNLCKDYNQS